MKFEKYWSDIEKLNILSEIAIDQLPSSLSKETKKRLMKRKPEEATEILKLVIDEVNSGNVESIDSLVKKRL